MIRISRSCRVACLAVVALVALTGAGTAQESSPPEIRLVDSHWTAWEAPEGTPEGAQIHTVVQGDTLWDLAEQYYGSPYLWPQLWERNKHIEDAHWIYAGDTLVVGVEVTPLEDLEALAGAAGSGDGTETGESDQFAYQRSSGDPEPLGGEDDIYCTGFIGESKQVFSYHLHGSEYDSLTPVLAGGRNATKLSLSTGDIVYLDQGRNSGLIAGSDFTVVKPMELVKHPATGKVLGRFYSFRGRIRLLSVQDESAIAEISTACHPIEGDDFVMPFTPQPIPLARRSGLRGINDPMPEEELPGAGWIVYSNEGILSLGEGHTVFIDGGELTSVTPGDFYTIYRETLAGQPPMIVGELAVLSVGQDTSLAIILESRYTIRVGDRLDPKVY